VLTITILGKPGLNEALLNKIFLVSGIIISIVLISWIFVMFLIREPLPGYFQGNISFYSDKIVINNKAISLNEITHLEFIIENYFNKPYSYSNHYTSPQKSQGVNNWVIIKYFDGNEDKIRFRIDYSNQNKLLEAFIVKCIKTNKMSLLHCLETLGISNYNKTQAFKKKYSIQC
jgi:ribosome-associated toxin RatA of RatAB toxin-antitoxin module